MEIDIEEPLLFSELHHGECNARFQCTAGLSGTLVFSESFI
jgi:hypothetical protein